MNLALFKVIMAQVSVHATMAGMRLAAPLLALQQGYSAAAVGILLALFALTQVFLALPAGRFADKHLMPTVFGSLFTKIRLKSVDEGIGKQQCPQLSVISQRLQG